MKITKILETSLYANDLESAENFYSRILGFETVSKKEQRHIFMRCGDQILLLFNPDKTIVETGLSPAHGAKGSVHIAFEIEKEVDWPQGGHSIYFRDPADNSLEITTSSIWRL